MTGKAGVPPPPPPHQRRFRAGPMTGILPGQESHGPHDSDLITVQTRGCAPHEHCTRPFNGDARTAGCAQLRLDTGTWVSSSITKREQLCNCEATQMWNDV